MKPTGKSDLVAKHLQIAMAALEAAFACLELEEPAPEDCEHENRDYLAMGQFRCEDCGETVHEKHTLVRMGQVGVEPNGDPRCNQ